MAFVFFPRRHRHRRCRCRRRVQHSGAAPAPAPGGLVFVGRWFGRWENERVCACVCVLPSSPGCLRCRGGRCGCVLLSLSLSGVRSAGARCQVVSGVTSHAPVGGVSTRSGSGPGGISAAILSLSLSLSRHQTCPSPKCCARACTEVLAAVEGIGWGCRWVARHKPLPVQVPKPCSWSVQLSSVLYLLLSSIMDVHL